LVICEKAITYSLVLKTPSFQGTWKFITGFEKAWASWIHSISSYPISLRSTLILFSHTCLVLPCGQFLLGFLTKILWVSCSLIHARCPTHIILPDFSNNTRWKLQIIQPLIMEFFPLYFFYRSNYSAHSFVLKHPQSTFFTQSKWSSFISA